VRGHREQRGGAPQEDEARVGEVAGGRERGLEGGEVGGGGEAARDEEVRVERPGGGGGGAPPRRGTGAVWPGRGAAAASGWFRCLVPGEGRWGGRMDVFHMVVRHHNSAQITESQSDRETPHPHRPKVPAAAEPSAARGRLRPPYPLSAGRRRISGGRFHGGDRGAVAAAPPTPVDLPPIV
jgi:hypothetical protein